MSDFDQTNRGVLFQNDRKEKDTHPDMQGSINIKGVDHWLSAWNKEGRNGTFLYISIGKPKDQQAPRQAAPRPASRPAPRSQAPAPAPRNPGGFDDLDDSEIPFRDPMKYRGFHLVI